MSPRPKLIPVPAIWAPKSNLGLILKDFSFIDRGPMLMFTTVDFFLVAGSTLTTVAGTDEDSSDGDGGFVVSAGVLEGDEVSVALCLVVWDFIGWCLLFAVVLANGVEFM